MSSCNTESLTTHWPLDPSLVGPISPRQNTLWEVQNAARDTQSALLSRNFDTHFAGFPKYSFGRRESSSDQAVHSNDRSPDQTSIELQKADELTVGAKSPGLSLNEYSTQSGPTKQVGPDSTKAGEASPQTNIEDEVEDEDDTTMSTAELDEISSECHSFKTAAELRADKRRMRRFRLTHNQTRFLMSEFARQAHPDAAQRERLSREVPGLSPRQVQVWFQNRRAKLKRLTTEDRERMVKSRALPDEIEPAQVIRPSDGLPRSNRNSMASSISYASSISDISINSDPRCHVTQSLLPNSFNGTHQRRSSSAAPPNSLSDPHYLNSHILTNSGRKRGRTQSESATPPIRSHLFHPYPIRSEKYPNNSQNAVRPQTSVNFGMPSIAHGAAGPSHGVMVDYQNDLPHSSSIYLSDSSFHPSPHLDLQGGSISDNISYYHTSSQPQGLGCMPQMAPRFLSPQPKFGNHTISPASPHSILLDNNPSITLERSPALSSIDEHQTTEWYPSNKVLRTQSLQIPKTTMDGVDATCNHPRSAPALRDTQPSWT